jgi:hypothetical protein
MQNLQTLITRIGDLVRLALPVVVGLALFGFFFGLAKFIFQSGDEKAVEEGKRIMKWGLVALFVMVSVWGIIGFFQRDLGIGGGGIIQVRPI